jgi:hypothetical protein
MDTILIIIIGLILYTAVMVAVSKLMEWWKEQ